MAWFVVQVVEQVVEVDWHRDTHAAGRERPHATVHAFRCVAHVALQLVCVLSQAALHAAL